MTDDWLDFYLDNILKASGSALKHYSMQKTKDDMRQALRQAIAGLESQEPVAHCEAGPNYCWKCLEESKPTYGSEEIAKLREVNKSLVKNIEELKKEPPPFWPVVQHLLDEYGLQFIDVVAAYREATQPAPVQEPEYVYTCNGCDTLYREDDVACDCTVNGLMEFTRHILAPDTTPPAQPPQRKCENCGEFGKCCMEAESQEQNFCPRCGKRTNDIHTCTPPQDNT